MDTNVGARHRASLPRRRSFRWAVLVLCLACSGTDPSAELERLGIERTADQLTAQAAAGKTEIVDLLIHSGLDVDARDRNGNTALLAASDGGHEDTVALLISRGANVDLATPRSGATALGIAATRGHAGAVRELLAAGAALEPREAAQGMTPLIGAAFAGHAEIVAELLAAGADRSARDRDGLTALDHARAQQHEDTARLLDGSEPPSNAALPAGWTLFDPFDDATPYWPEYASFSLARDPPVARRILLRSSVGEQAQVFLARGNAEAWAPRIEREIESWSRDPLLRASGRHRLRTADGIELELASFRIGRGALAGEPVSKILGSGTLPDGELAIVDAGGDPGSPGIAVIGRILEHARLSEWLGASAAR